jgi:molybdenum cofactor cytidylyltransferase
MSGVSAIVLAAGESRRMQGVNKLTLPVDGVPLLRHTVTTLLDSVLDEIVVVTAHGQDTARSLLGDLPVRTVGNERYAEGQMSSVYCGMQALNGPCTGVMICLSDQPLLQVADINRLVHAFLHRCPTTVLVPTWQGRRGNPVVLAWEHREAILDGARNLGCKHLIEKHPELVTPLAMDNDHVVFDIDTPGDYRLLLRRLASDQAEGKRRAAAGH